MKTIVTGGAGFIGSHLVDRLVASGHAVIVIDNFSTGRSKNLLHRGRPEVEVVQADVTDLETIAPYFEATDWVFHLAALADIVPSIQRPAAYHRANVSGTVAVLEAARAASVRRFV